MLPSSHAPHPLPASQAAEEGPGQWLRQCWVEGVTAWVAATHDRLAPFRTGPQLAYLTLAVLAVAAVRHRPDLMDPVPAASAPRTTRSTR